MIFRNCNKEILYISMLTGKLKIIFLVHEIKLESDIQMMYKFNSFYSTVSVVFALSVSSCPQGKPLCLVVKIVTTIPTARPRCLVRVFQRYFDSVHNKCDVQCWNIKEFRHQTHTRK